MKVCILGTGVMGCGIVSLFCKPECIEHVIWWGRESDSAEKGFVNVKKEISRYARKNAIDKEEVQRLLSKIRFASDFIELEGADIYIEAIAENFTAKANLLKKLADFVSESAIVATNTSSLSVTALSMNLNTPENFIGMHFFNPVSVMRLVEIIKGLSTSEKTLQRSLDLINKLGKSPVIVQESPGFIVNRMLIPMINEAVSILAEGVATKEDIDKAMVFGANHPLGPLALADLIGNDVCLSIMEVLQNETGDPKYRAHPLLRQYVRAGRLGRKVKQGFYKY